MNSKHISAINLKGAKAGTFESTLKTADLNWEVREDSVKGSHCGSLMPNKKMLYRSDTHEALGIVGNKYVPTDPAQFLKTQYEFAEEVGGKVIRAGWVDRRAKAFAVIELSERIDLPRDKRKVGDPVAAYIYSIDGWDGSTPRESSLYLERLRCANGMTTKVLESSLWVTHTKRGEERHKTAFKDFMLEVEDQMDDYRTQFKTLIEARMSQDEAKEFIAKLFKNEKKQETVLGLFNEGVGNQGKTRWDALNAVTEYVSHYQEFRDTKIAKADTTKFLGVMERNRLSERAMALLLN